VTVPTQLTLDGREVRHPAPTGPHLGSAQREILRHLGLFGSITSTQAGTIVHEQRRARRGYSGCGFGVKDDNAHSSYGGSGCCRYAVSDGTDVMKRLRERGFVEKHFGLWFSKTS